MFRCCRVRQDPAERCGRVAARGVPRGGRAGEKTAEKHGSITRGGPAQLPGRAGGRDRHRLKAQAAANAPVFVACLAQVGLGKCLN